MKHDWRNAIVDIEDDGVRAYGGRPVDVGAYCVIEKGRVYVGVGTRIRSFVELRAGTSIGAQCYIDSGVKMSGDCWIGDSVTVRYDAIIARGCEIGDETYICPQVMFNNLDSDLQSIGGAKVGKRCFIGTNATIAAGIEIADDVTVGAKALVTKNIVEPGTYIGIPARRVK